MRYYLDSESTGFGGGLISLALVREDGESVYWVIGDFDKDAVTPWVAANVIPVLANCIGQTDVLPHAKLARRIARWLSGDRDPVIIADWPDDIRHFCEAIITGPGSMIKLPSLRFEVRRIRTYPTGLKGAVRHNAWWDAMALRYVLEAVGT